MSGIDLPKLGFGTAAIALVDQSDAMASIDIALHAGIRYFDTAPLYGGGQAEVRLGQALADAAKEVTISTKCGRTRRFGTAGPVSTGEADVWDFSETAIIESIERSCERLKRDRLDIVFLHDIEAAQEQAFSEGLPVLRKLQAKGRIGAVGAGCNTVDGLLSALHADAADVILVAGRWTLLDRSAGKILLREAKEHSTKIVAGGILNSGCLANPDAPAAHFNYGPVTNDVRVQLRALAGVADEHNVSLTAAALQFPKRDPRVDTTLLGASSSGQLSKIMVELAKPIPNDFWTAVESMGLSH